MHPNRHFRVEDRQFHRELIDRIGFGMVFCDTPDGPRVAHTPILWQGEDRLRFHIARGNALTRHLLTGKALILVNGEDAYISARWYSEPEQVPTWNYLASEMEGTVEQLGREDLIELLGRLSEREEAKVTGGTPWTMDKMSDKYRDGMLKAIVGFEMTVTQWRATCKMSQNKPQSVRDEVILGLEEQGNHAMIACMRGETP